MHVLKSDILGMAKVREINAHLYRLPKVPFEESELSNLGGSQHGFPYLAR